MVPALEELLVSMTKMLLHSCFKYIYIFIYSHNFDFAGLYLKKRKHLRFYVIQPSSFHNLGNGRPADLSRQKIYYLREWND